MSTLNSSLSRSKYVVWLWLFGISSFRINGVFVLLRFATGVTAEALRANIGSKSVISLQRGLVDPKFQVEGVARRTNHCSSQKTRLNYLSYGVKILTDLSSVLSQCTRLTDRQRDGETDRRTAFSSLYRVCIPCRAVKIILKLLVSNLLVNCWLKLPLRSAYYFAVLSGYIFLVSSIPIQTRRTLRPVKNRGDQLVCFLNFLFILFAHVLHSRTCLLFLCKQDELLT